MPPSEFEQHSLGTLLEAIKAHRESLRHSYRQTAIVASYIGATMGGSKKSAGDLMVNWGLEEKAAIEAPLKARKEDGKAALMAQLQTEEEEREARRAAELDEGWPNDLGEWYTDAELEGDQWP